MEEFFIFLAGFLIGTLCIEFLRVYLDSRRKAKIIDMKKWLEERNKKDERR